MTEVVKAVAAPGSLPSDQLHFCGGAVKVQSVAKRKTPSELRGEQLKRRIAAELVHDAPARVENADVVDSAINKPEGPRNTRYIDMHLDEVYPARKPTSSLSLLSVKSYSKEPQVIEEMGGIKSAFLHV